MIPGHRYRMGVTIYFPAWSTNLGYLGFAQDQNSHDSSGASPQCHHLHLLLSKHEDKAWVKGCTWEKLLQKYVWWSWVYFVYICFYMCSKDPNILNWSAMAENAIIQGQYRSFGFLLYIWIQRKNYGALRFDHRTSVDPSLSQQLVHCEYLCTGHM